VDVSAITSNSVPIPAFLQKTFFDRTRKASSLVSVSNVQTGQLSLEYQDDTGASSHHQSQTTDNPEIEVLMYQDLKASKWNERRLKNELKISKDENSLLQAEVQALQEVMEKLIEENKSLQKQISEIADSKLPKSEATGEKEVRKGKKKKQKETLAQVAEMHRQELDKMRESHAAQIKILQDEISERALDMESFFEEFQRLKRMELSSKRCNECQSRSSASSSIPTLDEPDNMSINSSLNSNNPDNTISTGWLISSLWGSKTSAARESINSSIPEEEAEIEKDTRGKTLLQQLLEGTRLETKEDDEASVYTSGSARRPRIASAAPGCSLNHTFHGAMTRHQQRQFPPPAVLLAQGPPDAALVNKVSRRSSIEHHKSQLAKSLHGNRVGRHTMAAILRDNKGSVSGSRRSCSIERLPVKNAALARRLELRASLVEPDGEEEDNDSVAD